MITNATTRVSYAGNGSTAEFSVPFKFLADGDLVVIIRTALSYAAAESYVSSSTSPAVTSSYSVGDIVRGVHADSSNNIYECTVAGVAFNSSGPLWLWTPKGTGSDISTGTVLTWKFLMTDDGSTTQTLGSQYTVSGAGETAGGTVTFGSDYIPVVGEEVVIYNDPALTQNVDYVSGDAFPAETHETALDRVTLQQKRTREMVERSPTLPDYDIDGNGAFDARQNRIMNIAAPTRVNDAATKTYVDTAITNAAYSAPTGITATGSDTERTLAVRWADQFNVKDYGAAGTNLVDDTTNIQQAIDACNTANGGTVYFPRGNYKISDTLTVGSNTRILCDPDAWIKITNTPDKDIFKNKDQSGGNVYIDFDSVNIDSSAVTTSAEPVSGGAPYNHGAIHMVKVTDLRIRNCKIVNSARQSIIMRNNTRFDISHNTIVGSGTIVRSTYKASRQSDDGSISGHDVQSGSHINMGGDKHGVIDSNLMGRSWGASIIIFSNYKPTNAPEVYDVSITNNWLEGSEDNGIRLQPAGEKNDTYPYDPSTMRNIRIVGNVILDVIGHCIRVQGSNITVADNTIMHRTTSGYTNTWPYLKKLDEGENVGIALATGGHNITCTGNVLEDTGPDGWVGINMRIDGANWEPATAEGYVISNNVIKGCRSGIRCYGGVGDGSEVIRDLTISNNVITLNQGTVEDTADWDGSTAYSVGDIVKNGTFRYICTDAISASRSGTEPSSFGEVLPADYPGTGWSRNEQQTDGDGKWQVISNTEILDGIAVTSVTGSRISITGNNCSYGQNGIVVSGGDRGFTVSCTTVNTNATVTVAGGGTNAKLREGMAVSGTGIPDDTTVLALVGTTQFTMSRAATASATNTITFHSFINDVVVSNNICWNNGQEAGDGFGIYLADVDGFVVTGNRCMDTRPTKKQTWGIRTYTSADHDRDRSGIIALNNCKGNASGAFSESGDGLTGDLQIFGNLPTLPTTATAFTIGDGGGSIRQILSRTVTADIGTIADGNSSYVSVTGFTGLSNSDGDVVSIGVPHALANANGIIWNGYVASSSVVRIRVHNRSGSPFDPGSATYRAVVWKYN